MKIPEFNEMLQYRNEELLIRYRKDYPNNQLSAEQAFEEMKKYLWLGQKHKLDQAAHPEDEDLQFHFYLHLEMDEIDDMWHTFLLFTKDYMDFCHQYFDTYIHHVPTTESEKEKLLNNPDAMDKFIDEESKRQLSYIYDHLGEETLRTWFAEHFAKTE